MFRNVHKSPWLIVAFIAAMLAMVALYVRSYNYTPSISLLICTDDSKSGGDDEDGEPTDFA